mgnify:CR=1 FL=1
MEITVKTGSITRDFTGDYHITLVVPREEHNNMEPLNELLNDEKIKVCKIDHYRKKRSLNSNSYAWALITQIADKLRVSKEEVYLQMLKRYGQSSVVSVVEEATETFEKSVKYSERFGESNLNGKNFIHIKVYMGSSEFNSLQMSIFLDGIISEAESLKIPTITPAEVQRLKDNWKGEL